jgi:ABC-2 type transport system permease protein
MTLALLFKDELKGFYKSKVMLALWVGLPILSIIMFYASSGNVEGTPMSTLTAIVLGSVGGVLSAAMLVSSIISEKERHVYDLFLIRPVKRRDIVLSKFMSIYLCVAIAGFISLSIGLIIDSVRFGGISDPILGATFNSLLLALSMMAIACSAGVLIGFFSSSMLVGIILVIYGANQLSVMAALPGLLLPEQSWLTLIPGILLPIILLLLAMRLFEKKEL